MIGGNCRRKTMHCPVPRRTEEPAAVALPTWESPLPEALTGSPKTPAPAGGHEGRSAAVPSLDLKHLTESGPFSFSVYTCRMQGLEDSACIIAVSTDKGRSYNLGSPMLKISTSGKVNANFTWPKPQACYSRFITPYNL